MIAQETAAELRAEFKRKVGAGKTPPTPGPLLCFADNLMILNARVDGLNALKTNTEVPWRWTWGGVVQVEADVSDCRQEVCKPIPILPFSYAALLKAL